MAHAWIIPSLPIASARPVAVGTAMGDAAYVANDYAGVVWRSAANNTAAPNIQLEIDLGRDQSIDTVMLFGLTGPGAAATVVVQAATQASGDFTGAYYAGPAQALYAGSVMPVSGLGTALLTLPLGSYRYLRLSFSVPDNAQFVQIARVVVSKRIELERNFGFGGSFGVRDLGSLDFSARGVLLRRRGKKLRTASLTFSNIRKDEVEAFTKPLLEQIGNTEMIGLVTDPAEHPQRQNRCYFGPLVGDLGHAWRNAVAWEAKANLVSIF